MKKLHNKLTNKFKHYANWHQHPHHKKIHWVSFFLVAVFVLTITLGSVEKLRTTLYNIVLIEFSPRSAVLTLDPKLNQLKMGETFTANVILDTAGKPIDGVDLYSLHYDPTILSVEDSDLNQPGIQIKSGELMSITAVNSVDSKTGTIKFSQAAQFGAYYNGRGLLASINFKAVGKGNTYLNFDFSLGKTTDTNVAHMGRDQLINVVDALYTVVAK